MSRFRGDRIDPPDHFDECLDSDGDVCICDELEQEAAERRAESILDDLEWERGHG
jgi:hypothetical protein